MNSSSPKVALVTGANGITGNAIVDYLVKRPTSEWSRIVISSRSDAKGRWNDDRIEFVKVDFLSPLKDVVAALQEPCKGITHAYFSSYIHREDLIELRDLNVPLFKTFLDAIDAVAGSSLERVLLQTGGKYYGCNKGRIHAPMSEALTPRWEDGINFYYPQEDYLKEKSISRKWDYNIIRPNAIIGFTPGYNGMSECLTMALYLLICKETEEKIRFPGNEYYYNSVDDNSFAPSIAEMSIWSTTNEHTRNEDFNHQNGDIIVWRYFFGRLGQYFGLEIPEITEWTAKGKSDSSMESEFMLSEWAADKQEVWNSICRKYGGNPEALSWGSWFYFDWATSRGWVTITSMSKARKFGWRRYDDTFDTWVETFHAFEDAGILPRQPRHMLARTENQISDGRREKL